MNGLRTPVVAGLHPRAGTSTVAAVLHAHEGSGSAADVVCVGEHALPSALALAAAPAGLRPVLAVAAAAPRDTPAPHPYSPSTWGVGAVGGCEGLEPRFSAVVVVPLLPCWAGVPTPSEEIAVLLGLEADRVPLPLQAYAAALRDIAAAVVRSGLLLHGAPPVLLRPRADRRRRRAGSLRPVPALLPRPVPRPNPPALPVHPAAPGPVPLTLRHATASAAPVRLQVLAVQPPAAVHPVPGCGPAAAGRSGTGPLDDDALEAAGLAATGRVG